MNIRQWLGRARGIDRDIEVLLRARTEARAQLTRITQSYTGDVVQSAKDPHKFDRLLELENLLDQKTDELLAAKREIADAIMSLEDGRHRRVLLSYYVRCMSMEEIAVEQHYSYRQVKRFHRGGIEECERRTANAEKNMPPEESWPPLSP